MSRSPVTLTKPKRAKKAKAKPQLTNHVCFIIDRSSSMNGLQNDVVRVFNEQAAVIRESAKASNQKTTVSLITFASTVDDAVFFHENVEELGDLTRNAYRPQGMTALLDATGVAIEMLLALPDAKDEETSFLIIVITDGHENASRSYNWASLSRSIQKVNATDRWTFAFLTPPHYESGLSQRLNIPQGNVKSWEATEAGVEEASGSIAIGTRSYFSSRASGKRSVKSFFSPDLKDVNPRKIRKKLHNVSGEYQIWPIDKKTPIQEFVEDQGEYYIPGCAFFQLTKKETVQSQKSFCLRNKLSGKIYEGNEAARKVMGLPEGGTIMLEPGEHGRYDVFVQSTSNNRNLMPGTDVLYKSRKKVTPQARARAKERIRQSRAQATA